MGILSGLFGSYSKRELARIEPIKQRVLNLDEEYQALSNAELKAKTQIFKDRIAAGESLDDILPEALAACREAVDRFWVKALSCSDYRCNSFASGVLLK